MYPQKILDHSERTFFFVNQVESQKKESSQKKSVAGLEQEHRVFFQRGKFDLSDGKVCPSVHRESLAFTIWSSSVRVCGVCVGGEGGGVKTKIIGVNFLIA